jgi:Mrp family chromosome partitioning ATPase
VSGEHYLVLGLAQVRASWFGDVSRWATTAALPLDFVKCVSVDELRARIESGRPCSAVLVDGALPALDRDLVDVARTHGAPVIAVDAGHVRRDWPALGVSAVLPEPLGRDALAAVLRQHGRPLLPVEAALHGPVAPGEGSPLPTGRLVAVTGSGGTGTSTLAVACAQALATTHDREGGVVLADLARHADQAMLHDAGDVIPGVQELADAHRNADVDSDSVRRLTFFDDDRGYHLLLGLRRHRDWTTLRPRAFEATLDSLLRSFTVTVADVDADLEGEEECGSLDVEERNLMTRSTLALADVVVVTGLATLTGLRRLARLAGDVMRFGVAPSRLVPVVNRAPRSPRRRAEIARALADLVGAEHPTGLLVSPLFVPGRRQLDDLFRDGIPLPQSFVTPLGDATQAVLERFDRPAPAEPPAVVPGSLGTWTDPP